jgi:hypothetical protein
MEKVKGMSLVCALEYVYENRTMKLVEIVLRRGKGNKGE